MSVGFPCLAFCHIIISLQYHIQPLQLQQQNIYLYLGSVLSDDDSESVSREASPSLESPRPVSQGSESPLDNIHASVMASAMMSSSTCTTSLRQDSKVSPTNNFCLYIVGLCRRMNMHLLYMCGTYGMI